MMHPDIIKAVDLIDSKISELQRAKQTLLDAFGEQSINHLQPSLFRLKKSVVMGSSRLTRKDEIKQFLKAEGPLSRSEIIKKSKIPPGTVAMVLKDKNVFISRDGKWSLVEEGKENGLTP